MRIKIRRMSNAARLLLSGANAPHEGELVYTTDTKLTYIGDGTTTGGNPLGSTLIAGTIASGYFAIRHKTGLIEQHIPGTSFAASGSVTQVVTFPVAFPNALTNVVISHFNNGGANEPPVVRRSTGTNTSQLTVFCAGALAGSTGFEATVYGY